MLASRLDDALAPRVRLNPYLGVWRLRPKDSTKTPERICLAKLPPDFVGFFDVAERPRASVQLAHFGWEPASIPVRGLYDAKRWTLALGGSSHQPWPRIAAMNAPPLGAAVGAAPPVPDGGFVPAELSFAIAALASASSFIKACICGYAASP